MEHNTLKVGELWRYKNKSILWPLLLHSSEFDTYYYSGINLKLGMCFLVLEVKEFYVKILTNNVIYWINRPMNPSGSVFFTRIHIPE